MKKTLDTKELIRNTLGEIIETQPFFRELSKALDTTAKRLKEYKEKGLCPYCSKKVTLKNPKHPRPKIFCCVDHKTAFTKSGKPHLKLGESHDFGDIRTKGITSLKEAIKRFEFPDLEFEEKNVSREQYLLERLYEGIPFASSTEDLSEGPDLVRIMHCYGLINLLLPIEGIATAEEIRRKREEEKEDTRLRASRKAVIAPLLSSKKAISFEDFENQDEADKAYLTARESKKMEGKTVIKVG